MTTEVVDHIVGGPTVEHQNPDADRLDGSPSPSPDEVMRTRTEGLLRGWDFVLRHHRCPAEVISDLRLQLSEYLTVPDESLFFKRAKYIGPMVFAWYARVEPPKAPDAPFFFKGRVRRWARSRRFVNRRNTHLWYSLLQGKRAAHPLSEDMVQKTYLAHREAMEKEDPLDDETLERVMERLRPILGFVARRLRDAYRTDDDLDDLAEPGWQPSKNSAFEATRSNGGQQREIFRRVTDDLSGVNTVPLSKLSRLERDADVGMASLCEIGEGAEPDLWQPFEEQPDPDWAAQLNDYAVQLETVVSNVEKFERTRGAELVSMQFYPRILINGRVRTNVVVEFFDEPSARDAWTDAFSSILLNQDTGRPFRCEIHGILEPLKVRVISKGESVPYYGSKELQKRLHGVLREIPAFRLIGRRLCPTDLFDCAENPVGGNPADCEWFSIDYSSATDCLSAKLSSRILEALVSELPRRMQEIWRRVLAPHECFYPKYLVENPERAAHLASPCRFCVEGRCNEFEQIREFLDATVPSVLQKNGQLMGSPLSFPVLCLANLGLYLEVIRDDPRPLREKMAGVLVNGDDMLYVAPFRYWKAHQELGLRIGLEMTVGKAYHHPVIANANSTCFHMDLTRYRRGDFSSSTPVQVSFLNSGLYFGQQKVMGKVDDGLQSGGGVLCSQLVDELLRGALPGRACALLADYLVLHKDEIVAECQGRNLFLPASLGGMDQTAPVGWKYRVTADQLQLATRLVLHLGPYLSFGIGPHPSPAVEEVVPPVQAFDFLDPSCEARTRDTEPARGVVLKRRYLELPFTLVRAPIRGWRKLFAGDVENRSFPRSEYSIRPDTAGYLGPRLREELVQTKYFAKLLAGPASCSVVEQEAR